MKAGELQQQLATAQATIRVLQDELAETNRGLLALTMELEQRVDERTAELRAADKELKQTNSELKQLTLGLEDRVARRTAELNAASETLEQSRIAALNLMEDAIAARDQAEQTNADLQHEIEERNRAEEALRQKAAELSEAQRLAHLGNWYWAAQTDAFTGSDELLRIYGLDPATQSMPAFRDQKGRAYPEEEWERINAAVQKTMQTGTGYELDVKALRADGATIWITTRGEAVRDTGGRIVGLRGTGQDITARKRTMEALTTSELRYRRLFESAKDGILILDAGDGMVVDVNPFLIEMLGYSHEVFLGKKVWELGFFKDIVANQDNFAELQQKEYIRYEDMTLETAAGRRIEVEFVSNVYQVNHQKVIQCNIRDITDRKRAEAALRESHERYHRTLDQMLEGGQIIGFDWRYRYVNEAAARQGHCSRDALLGRTMMEAYPGIENTSMFAVLRRCLTERTPSHLENEFTFPDGTVGWFELSIQPVQDGIFILSVDITARQRAEAEIRQLNADLERRVQVRTAALHASELRYRRLFESAKDGILILDAGDGMVVDVNPFLIEMLGYSHEVFLGKKVWELGFFKDIVANQDNFAELQQKEYIRYEDMALETAAGRRIEVEFISNVYQVNDRKVIQCNIRDITERKRAEAALLKAHELLQRRATELKAFNRAMVDREQRIIEMKEEVNALCQELGRAPEYPPVWKR